MMPSRTGLPRARRQTTEPPRGDELLPYFRPDSEVTQVKVAEVERVREIPGHVPGLLTSAADDEVDPGAMPSLGASARFLPDHAAAGLCRAGVLNPAQ
jgi:hypothetical protein